MIQTLSRKEGLEQDNVYPIFSDSAGRVWAGVWPNNLARYEHGRFKTILISNETVFITSFFEDASGRLWFGNIGNLSYLRGARPVDFTGQAGFAKGTEFSAITQTGDGALWFGTNVGRGRYAGGRASVYTTGDGLPDITLAPGQTNLEISYTALSYLNSGQLKFKYKLENLDEDWNDVGTRRAAYYSHLPPGEYTFRVVAANRDGVWNEQGASLRVRIRPPFYRTWWFTLLACVAGAALILLAFYVRLRQLKAKAAQQEEFARQLIDSQELERGRIAAELHDGLSQSLAIIKNRALLSLSRPDDRDHALEQLHEISDASSEAIDEVKEIIYDLRPIQLDRLGLTGAVEDIAEKVAAVNDLKLFKEVEDVDNIFPKPWENSVYRIVQEALNNVVKHSGAGEVRVNVSRGRSEVSIIIKDDGVGFEPNALDVNRRIGFGLLGMSERAKLLGGRTTFESARGAGTKVTVVRPLKADRASLSPGGAGR